MTGRTIGHYKLLDKLGAGGMGEVWKAEDTQLRRTVALKFLSSETIGDEEVKARLIREAQASASLDHPNICQVFGIHEEKGETFIAMAYIDGPSLADKIKERPLPLDEALDIAIHIAEGLQEAHEKGVVHRDIKPQNVMLTGKGQVKIMDFGLASLSGRSRLTKSGTTLGTPAYMAPEQLEGRDVDRRADIWALGCVLYEMLTQHTPFDAEYEQAIAYGILNDEPEPASAQRSDVKPSFDRVLSKALAKNPEERYQHVDELLVDVRRQQRDSSTDRIAASATQTVARQDSATAAETTRPGPLHVWRSATAFLAALVVLLSAALLWRDADPPAQIHLRKLMIPVVGNLLWPAISPDGRRVVFVTAGAEGVAGWVQELDQEEPRSLGAPTRVPFWSPDSRLIGFRDEDRLKTVAADGGESSTLCPIPDNRFYGGTWSTDGSSIVFSAGEPPALYRVSTGGGEPALLVL